MDNYNPVMTDARTLLELAATELYFSCLVSLPILQQVIKDDPDNLAAKNCIKRINAAIDKAEGKEQEK